jgi:CHAD domain-containing protein
MKAAERSMKERYEELKEKLAKLLAKQETTPEAVHRIRTTARRIQSIVRFHELDDGSSVRKTLKQLKQLRRSAGKVRDFDVMARLLATVQADGISGERRRVQSAIETAREKKANKLAGKIADGVASDLVAHIQALPVPASRTSNRDETYVDGALKQFAEQAAQFETLDESNLHDFRMVCKRAKYVVELAGEGELAEGVHSELKAMQDAIGEWHDWVQLADLAKQTLAEPDAPLIVAIRAARRAKYSAACVAAERGREQLAFLRQGRTSAPGRKPPAKATGSAPSLRRVK